MSRTTFTDEINAASTRTRLNADLVEALVIVESGGNPWAMRYEPMYRWLWDVRAKVPFRVPTDEELSRNVPPNDFPSRAGTAGTEWFCQRCSIGLMQIMGALARERGFSGDRFLTELCGWEENLRIGTEHLSILMRWAGGDERVALGAYNAGKGGARSEAGRRYSEKVMNAMQGLGPRP